MAVSRREFGDLRASSASPTVSYRVDVSNYAGVAVTARDRSSQLAIASVLLIGCSAPSVTHSVDRHIDASSVTRREVRGRVTLDGEPVRFFGVCYTKQDKPCPMEPFGYYTSDGRFAMRMEPGVWNLVIAGPSFGRHVERVWISQVDRVTTIAIKVQRGATVEGRVTDETGAAAAHVHVEIEQRAHAGTSLGELAQGNYATTTDKTGHYRLENVTLVSLRARARLFARDVTGHRRSFAAALDKRDYSTDLVLVPVGRIAGTVFFHSNRYDSFGVPPFSHILIRSPEHPDTVFSATTDADGKYTVEVPVAAYTLAILWDTGTTYVEGVVVSAGTTTVADLSSP